jgi:hypothetical protein
MNHLMYIAILDGCILTCERKDRLTGFEAGELQLEVTIGLPLPVILVHFAGCLGRWQKLDW